MLAAGAAGVRARGRGAGTVARGHIRPGDPDHQSRCSATSSARRSARPRSSDLSAGAGRRGARTARASSSTPAPGKRRPLHLLVIGIAGAHRRRSTRSRPTCSGSPTRARSRASDGRSSRRAAAGRRLADARRARQRDLLVGRGARRGVPPARAAGNDPVVDAIARRRARADRSAREPGRPRALRLAEHCSAAPPTPDGDRAAAEHDEPWPGGRSNHYLFDMNRDWFAQSQPETRGREQVVARLLPAGRRRPARDGRRTARTTSRRRPIRVNPLHHQRAGDVARDVRPRQRRALRRARLRRTSSARSTTRSIPGYGESWPMYQGAIGMTYEQASARGLALQARRTARSLTYRDGILHHFTSAITTCYTAATNREQLLRDFLEYRRTAISDGEKVATREYVLIARIRSDAGRSARREPRQPGHRRAPRGGGLHDWHADRSPAGAYLVSNAQPSGRLLRNLLEPDVHAARGVRQGAGSPPQEAAGRSDLRRHRVEPAGRFRRGGASRARRRSA